MHVWVDHLAEAIVGYMVIDFLGWSFSGKSLDLKFD